MRVDCRSVARLESPRHPRGLFTNWLFVSRRVLTEAVGAQTFETAWAIKLADFVCEFLTFTGAGEQAHQHDQAKYNRSWFEDSYHSGIHHHYRNIIKATGFVGQINQALGNIVGCCILTETFADFIIGNQICKPIGA